MSEAEAVYFHPRDYAGFIRRILVPIIDVTILMFVLGLMTYAVSLVHPVSPDVAESLKTLNFAERAKALEPYNIANRAAIQPYWYLLAIAYFFGMRFIRGGTLGHRLVRVRLVDMTGELPRPKTIFLRELLAIPATWLFGASYFFCLFTKKHQAFHDMWLGTWVVKARAKPAGPAQIDHRAFMPLGFLLTYPDVNPPTPQPAGDAADATTGAL